jgi:hypothetical protein
MGPRDIVHFSLCGNTNIRFHSTIRATLIEKHEDFIEKKVDQFARQVAVYVDQLFSVGQQVDFLLETLLEFLTDNLWFKEIPKSFGRMERKLLEFASVYSKNAMASLNVLFDVRSLANGEDVVWNLLVELSRI